MLDITDKALRILNSVVLAVLIVMGSVMFIVSMAHIFCRYALNDSLTWSEEFLKILVVWFCLLSASMISARREHIRITAFKNMLLAKPLDKAADYLVSILMFAISLTMCWIGFKLTAWTGMRKTPVLRIPFFYMYASIFVSFGIMTLYELRNLVVDFFTPGRPAIISEKLGVEELLVKEMEAQEKHVISET